MNNNKRFFCIFLVFSILIVKLSTGNSNLEASSSYLNNYMNNNNDSIFYISLRQDTIPGYVNLIFENVSNDTVLLFTEFEDFFSEFKSYGIGFRIFYYFNEQLGIPNWGEMPISHYKILGSTINRMDVAPKEKVVLPIYLPIAFSGFSREDQIKIIIEINYRYFIYRSKTLETKHLFVSPFILENILSK